MKMKFLNENRILKLILIFNFISKIELLNSCGIRSARIINGEVAPNNNWPWIVSLQKYTDASKSKRDHFCGGSLISPQYILTAAHCFIDSNDLSLIVAKLGSNYALEPGKIENLYEVAEVYNNKNYDDKNFNNDISIVKLKKSVVLSQNISTICLPDTKDIDLIIGKEVYIAGWGSSDGFSNAESFKNELLQAKLKIYDSQSVCFNDLTYHYCAFDATAKRSSVCTGDSGGPMIYSNQGKWYLYGLSSYSYDNNFGACDVTKASYFTKIPAYINWIEEYLYNQSFKISFSFKIILFFVFLNIFFN